MVLGDEKMEAKQTHLIVQCNRCGTLNRKKVDDHEVTCMKCGKKLSFVVLSSGLIPPQAESFSLEYNQQTKYLGTEEGKKDSKEWKEIVKAEEKELEQKRKDHYKYEEKFKKEKVK